MIRKQFCLRGHDTFVVGRTKDRECKTCNVLRERKRNRTPASRASRHRYSIKSRALKRAGDRRAYLRDPDRYKDRAKKWAKENWERVLEIARRSRVRNRGVNFWVEQVKESI